MRTNEELTHHASTRDTALADMGRSGRVRLAKGPVTVPVPPVLLGEGPVPVTVPVAVRSWVGPLRVMTVPTLHYSPDPSPVPVLDASIMPAWVRPPSTAAQLKSHRGRRAADVRVMRTWVGPVPVPVPNLARPVMPVPVPMPVRCMIEPSHAPVPDRTDGPATWASREERVIRDTGADGRPGDHVARRVVRSQGPWQTMVPSLVDDKGNVTHVITAETRVHGENVAWCRSCGAVGRTASDIRHVARTVRRRCPSVAVVGATLDAVLDGPDVLTVGARITVNSMGVSVVTGPAFNGTGRVVRPDVTPDVTARSVKGRTRISRRRPDGGRITVGRVTAWCAGQPVEWMTTITDPDVTAHRARVESMADMAVTTVRYAAAVTAGLNRWLCLPSVAPAISYGPTDDQMAHVAHGRLTAEVLTRLAVSLGNVPDRTDDTVAPVRVTILKADGTAYKPRTGRRTRAAIIASAAPTVDVAAVRPVLDDGGLIG